MSAPYEHQQNGTPERWNRTILEKAECMRLDAGLSQAFWEFAVAAAVHIYNHQPMARHKWKTPIEMWEGKQPDVSYFRVFGCKASVLVNKELRRKGDPKSQFVMFIGYAPDSKAYLLWDRTARKVITSSNVQFDESVFPHKENSSLPSTPAAPQPIEFESLVDLELDPVPDPQPANDPPQPLDPVPVPQVPVPRQVRQRPPVPEEPVDPQPLLERRERRAGAGQRFQKDSHYGGHTATEIWDATTSEGTIKLGRLPDAQKDPPATFVNSILVHAIQEKKVPLRLKEALSSPDAPKWEQAIKSEYDSLMENHTWDEVDLPAGCKAIKCKWVFDIKRDGRYKARLVAKGFTQVYGFDYEETFLPVARFESVQFLLSLATLEDWEIHGMDIKTAFLNGDLDKEIYMELPEGFGSHSPRRVARLNKALYGLKQASQQWYKKIHATLIGLGFCWTHSDTGIYVYRQQVGDTVIILILYVDDILLLGNSLQEIERTKSVLASKFKMTDLGEALDFLGLRIQRDQSK
ncbi:hypothetical protein JAAARDRAFT_190048 [Jaapia argillacea MUCL 33604]|uniref:Integrase catalytic domain-containing protein n=1 Tax=Jaapia argillacea MUCL 33604 TaxID=933084 RepID=A0A067Q6U0_9AGAM|nr:hypothetical protein JAAARDRAFT_190048 [Jaapia argillacea MUCL 33604]